MLWYFTKRILHIFLIVLVVVFIVFLLLYFLPGTDTSQFNSREVSDNLNQVLEYLDGGFFADYIRYCYNLFIKFDLGVSSYKTQISQQIALRLRPTFLLAGISLAATLIIGIPAGIIAAIHKDKWKDNFITVVTVFVSSIPVFLLALILTLIFALKLKWLPVSGLYDVKSFILPITTLSFGGIAILTKMTRSSMIEVLNKQFITGLRAKGLKEVWVIYCHALKNLLIPVVSVISTLASQLLCGALIVERFFSIPGIGSYMVEAISRRDSAVILGCIVIFTVILSLVAVISDIAYALINPKFRSQYRRHENLGEKRSTDGI